MADLGLVTADKVNVGTLTVQQHTAPAAEAITAGAPVLFDANGKWVNGDANAAGKIGAWGIALRTVAAGQALTVLRRGILEGLDLSALAYGASLFLSNTAGRIADAAGGTSVLLGHVIPVFGAPMGAAADKVAMIECTGTGASA